MTPEVAAPSYAFVVHEVADARVNWPGYVVIAVLAYAVVLISVFPGFALVGVVVPGFWLVGVSLPIVASIVAGVAALGRAARIVGLWRRGLMLAIALLAGLETFAFVIALLQIRHWGRL